MGNTEIRQHKEMAMGKSPDVGGDCQTAFRGGMGESVKGKHLKEHQRAMKKMSKSVDHGPHGMGMPRDRDGDYDGD